MTTVTTRPVAADVYDHPPVPLGADVYDVDDLVPPRQALHLLLVIADDFPMTSTFQAKNKIPVAAPGEPPGSNTALLANTTTLEMLAANGVRIRSARAYVECSPTRALLATAQYGFRTGIGNVINLNATQAGDLGEFGDPGFVFPTLFQRLSNAGVRTSMIGKIHQSADYNQNFNGRDGLGWQILERFCALDTDTITTLRNLNQQSGDLLPNGNQGSYYKYPINFGRTNQQEVLIDSAVLGDAAYNTTYLTDRAIEWWSTATNDQPSFMWLAYNATHTPLGGAAPNTKRDFPPAALVSTQEYIDKADEEAAGGSLVSFWEDQMAAAEAVDAELGRLLDSIPVHIREKLVVVFIADNGIDSISQPAAISVWGKDYGDDWNFIIGSPSGSQGNRMKGSLYHYGSGVECIWSGPGIASSTMPRAGQFFDGGVDAVDVSETIAQFFGTTMAPCDGVSYFNALYIDGTVDHRTAPRLFQYSETFNPNGDWRDNLTTANDTSIQLNQSMWGWYFTPLASEPTGRYCLIRKRGADGVADDAWHYELYRHYDEDYGEVDPYERTNLYGDATYQAVADDLEARIDALLNSGSGGGNSITVEQSDGVTTKVIFTALHEGEEAIPIEKADGTTTKYVLPGIVGSAAGMPVEESGGKIVPYTDTPVEEGLALPVESGTAGPSASIRYIVCDENDALPVENAGGRVIASSGSTIPVEESGGRVLALVEYS